VRGRVVGVVNEDPSAGLKTSQRLTPAASTRARACAGSGHGAAVFTTGLPSIRPCGKPAAPLRHVAGFPGAGLLRGLCHARAPSADGAPARHPAGHRAGRAAPRRFPRSLATGQRGRDRAFTPAASPRVRRRPSARSPGPHRLDNPEAGGLPTGARPALHRPASTRFWAVFESRGISYSFAIAIPSRLASAADVSGSTTSPLRCQGCSRPPRHLPDQAALGF
jgi:hypothetical protein